MVDPSNFARALKGELCGGWVWHPVLGRAVELQLNQDFYQDPRAPGPMGARISPGSGQILARISPGFGQDLAKILARSWLDLGQDVARIWPGSWPGSGQILDPGPHGVLTLEQ